MREDSYRWGGTEIAYSYRFRSATRLAISVLPDRSVRVTAPRGTSLERIREKVAKRAAWIDRAKREFARLEPLDPPRLYVPGETHRYLGRQYRLRVRVGGEPGLALCRGFLEFGASELPTRRELRREVERWFRARAGMVFDERLGVILRRPVLAGLPRPQVTVRRMRRRWGSCTRAGRILLNPDLVHAPRDLVDYVIAHELCHLVEHHHGSRFWGLLTRVLPDWAARRAELRRFR